jgi:hypothetical protein
LKRERAIVLACWACQLSQPVCSTSIAGIDSCRFEYTRKPRLARSLLPHLLLVENCYRYSVLMRCCHPQTDNSSVIPGLLLLQSCERVRSTRSCSPCPCHDVLLTCRNFQVGCSHKFHFRPPHLPREQNSALYEFAPVNNVTVVTRLSSLSFWRIIPRSRLSKEPNPTRG